MHVLFRESHGLEETALPRDLGQAPAPLVVLSFSDSDLAAFAAGWHLARAGDPAFPALRLANLAALEHPLSVDTYVEQTLDAAGEGARAILIRLIGGASWWRYGLAQVAALARARGIALAVLPADGRADAQLDEASTLPPATLAALAHRAAAILVRRGVSDHLKERATRILAGRMMASSLGAGAVLAMVIAPVVLLLLVDGTLPLGVRAAFFDWQARLLILFVSLIYVLARWRIGRRLQPR